MSFAAAMPRPAGNMPYSNPGISAAAKSAREAFEKKNTSNDARSVIRLDELTRVFLECRSNDWDGYGAQAVAHGTYICAERLLEALPSSIPTPEIAAHPDGEVAFEWFISKTYSLDLSISGDGRITFVALLGHQRRKGTDKFVDTIPSDILGILNRLYP